MFRLPNKINLEREHVKIYVYLALVLVLYIKSCMSFGLEKYKTRNFI